MQAAEQLFRSIVAMAAGEHWELRLFAAAKREMTWPSPPTGSNVVALDVSADLMVHFGAANRAFAMPMDQCVGLFQAFAQEHPNGIRLAGFIGHLVCWRPRAQDCRHSLLGQVCLRLAQRIDDVIGATIENSSSQHQRKFQVELAELGRMGASQSFCLPSAPLPETYFSVVGTACCRSWCGMRVRSVFLCSGRVLRGFTPRC